jgi:hypothetical protein
MGSKVAGLTRCAAGDAAPLHRELDTRQKELLPLKQALSESDSACPVLVVKYLRSDVGVAARVGVLRAEQRMLEERAAAAVQDAEAARAALTDVTARLAALVRLFGLSFLLLPC